MNTTMRPNDILGDADRLQVGRPDAVACVAEVVKCQSFWDWADQLRVGPAMGTHGFTVTAEHPVATNLRAVVNPALSEFGMVWRVESSLYDLAPEALLRGNRIVKRRVAVPNKPHVVGCTPTTFAGEMGATAHSASALSDVLHSWGSAAQGRAMSPQSGVVSRTKRLGMNRVLATINGAQSKASYGTNVTQPLYAMSGVE